MANYTDNYNNEYNNNDKEEIMKMRKTWRENF